MISRVLEIASDFLVTYPSLLDDLLDFENFISRKKQRQHAGANIHYYIIYFKNVYIFRFYSLVRRRKKERDAPFVFQGYDFRFVI